MSESLWLALTAVTIAAVWYLSFLARRLDRLHRRVEGAAGALDVQLLRRVQAVTAVSITGLLDPASQVLLFTAATVAADAAPGLPAAAREPYSRLTGYPSEREAAESDLSRTLRATLDELPLQHPLLSRPESAELREACHRAQLARRLHNDAAVTALAVRRNLIVRWLRLAGAAPMPRTIEIDDEPPAILRGVG